MVGKLTPETVNVVKCLHSSINMNYLDYEREEMVTKSGYHVDPKLTTAESDVCDVITWTLRFLNMTEIN